MCRAHLSFLWVLWGQTPSGPSSLRLPGRLAPRLSRWRPYCPGRNRPWGRYRSRLCSPGRLHHRRSLQRRRSVRRHQHRSLLHYLGRCRRRAARSRLDRSRRQGHHRRRVGRWLRLPNRCRDRLRTDLQPGRPILSRRACRIRQRLRRHYRDHSTRPGLRHPRQRRRRFRTRLHRRPYRLRLRLPRCQSLPLCQRHQRRYRRRLHHPLLPRRALHPLPRRHPAPTPRPTRRHPVQRRRRPLALPGRGRCYRCHLGGHRRLDGLRRAGGPDRSDRRNRRRAGSCRRSWGTGALPVRQRAAEAFEPSRTRRRNAHPPVAARHSYCTASGPSARR